MTVIERQRVLVVDDEPSMRTTLADILVESGFDASTAEDGELAIEMCELEAYDVVLMDLHMPGIDGVAALRRIRQFDGRVRVILMSACGDEDTKQEALREGAIAFLDKPLNLETVIHLVADATGLAVLAVTNDDRLAGLFQSLTSSGQQLTVARSHDEAVKLVGQLKFDVAFIDVELPPANGLECYLALRKISSTLTAIMISAADGALLAIADEAVKRRAYTVITKPLQQEILVELIRLLRAQRLSGSIRKPNGGNS